MFELPGHNGETSVGKRTSMGTPKASRLSGTTRNSPANSRTSRTADMTAYSAKSPYHSAGRGSATGAENSDGPKR